MMLNEEEKKELKELTKSAALRKDLKLLSKTRHNPFFKGGKVDMDKLLTFLTDYNCFINHSPRPLSKIIDKDMRL